MGRALGDIRMRRSNWTIFRYALQVAVLVAMSVPTKPLLADTTLDSGTTTVSTGTNFGTRLYVASTGTATMNVVAGGYATDSIGYLGYSADSLGFATVSSGTWAHSLALFVGNDGAGVFTVSGGKVTCGTQGFVGTNPGSIGTATVSSGTWAMSGDLYVGSSGTGTLNVTGGSVTYRTGNIGSSATGVGAVTVSDGGNFAGSTGTSSLTVGNSGTGTLNVTGGRVTNGTGGIGTSAGSVGTATVSSGTWANSGSLTVGSSGTGTLNVTGGYVSNTSGILGSAAGSNGTATVSSGTWANLGGDLVVGVSGTGTLTINGGLVLVAGTLSKGTYGTINLNAGGTLQIGAGFFTGVLGISTLTNNGTLIFNRSNASTYSGIIGGTGTIQNAGTGTTTLTGQTSFTNGLGATAGRLIAGSASSVNGFSTTGNLTATSGATLELKSRGLAYVNGLSTLTGGTILAANGISLGAGANVVGTGVISGFVSGAYGSRVEADGGKLTVGDASSYVGFASAGMLYTNYYEVELLDRNLAVLGSLTQLGDDFAGGTLRAANGMLLEQGKNLTGRGTVYGNFVNQGDVYGDDSVPLSKIVFAAGSTVSGIGSFENVVFDGTYSPGNSPAITNLSNGEFSAASSLLIELGGTQPGTQYDRVVDSGVLTLLGGTLNVALYNGFVPSYGNSFEILQYGQLSGDFGTVNYPALSGGLSWEQTTSATAMTITVVPEPSTYAMAAIATAGLAGLMRWRKRRSSESAV
jgi:T5SS/PEP-CTERM-associated repeat protein